MAGPPRRRRRGGAGAGAGGWNVIFSGAGSSLFNVLAETQPESGDSTCDGARRSRPTIRVERPRRRRDASARKISAAASPRCTGGRGVAATHRRDARAALLRGSGARPAPRSGSRRRLFERPSPADPPCRTRRRPRRARWRRFLLSRRTRRWGLGWTPCRPRPPGRASRGLVCPWLRRGPRSGDESRGAAATRRSAQGHLVSQRWQLRSRARAHAFSPRRTDAGVPPRAFGLPVSALASRAPESSPLPFCERRVSRAVAPFAAVGGGDASSTRAHRRRGCALGGVEDVSPPLGSTVP